MFQTEHLQEKWQPVLEHPDLPKIEDSYKRAVTTLIPEKTPLLMPWVVDKWIHGIQY